MTDGHYAWRFKWNTLWIASKSEYNISFLCCICSVGAIILEGPYDQSQHHLTSADLWSNVAMYSGPFYGLTNVPAHLSLWILLQWTVPCTHTHTHTHRYWFVLTVTLLTLPEWIYLKCYGLLCVLIQLHVCTLKANFQCLTASWCLTKVSRLTKGHIFFLLLKPFHSCTL